MGKPKMYKYQVDAVHAEISNALSDKQSDLRRGRSVKPTGYGDIVMSGDKRIKIKKPPLTVARLVKHTTKNGSFNKDDFTLRFDEVLLGMTNLKSIREANERHNSNTNAHVRKKMEPLIAEANRIKLEVTLHGAEGAATALADFKAMLGRVK